MSGAVDDALAQLLRDYGDALFDGDVGKLGALFHPQAMLYGEVRGQPYRKTLAQYLEVVAGRRSPRALGEQHGMNVLSIEVTHTIALARMRCVMLGFDYTDYLSLVNTDGRWQIVSKVFTDVPRRTVSA